MPLFYLISTPVCTADGYLFLLCVMDPYVKPILTFLSTQHWAFFKDGRWDSVVPLHLRTGVWEVPAMHKMAATCFLYVLRMRAGPEPRRPINVFIHTPLDTSSYHSWTPDPAVLICVLIFNPAVVSFSAPYNWKYF